jgi:hypothetical protein
MGKRPTQLRLKRWLSHLLERQSCEQLRPRRNQQLKIEGQPAITVEVQGGFDPTSFLTFTA